MIVDTSAIIAILRNEPDAEVYSQAVAAAHQPRMSAGTFLEAAIVVDANGDPVLSGRFDDLITASAIEVVPVTRQHAETARLAYRAFGKGRGHGAQLNLGDCFAYALARQTGEPLLFKGADFGQTDIQPAVEPQANPPTRSGP